MVFMCAGQVGDDGGALGAGGADDEDFFHGGRIEVVVLLKGMCFDELGVVMEEW
jgi:hypothetical protein